MKPIVTSGRAARCIFRLNICSAGLLLWLCAANLLQGQNLLSPWGANVLTNQVGTSNWAYFSVNLPIGYAGFVLTAENVTGAGGLELFVQSNTNPTEISYAKRSVAGTRLLELTAAELIAGECRVGLLFQGDTAGTAAQNRLRLIPILSPGGGAITNQVVQGQDLYFRLVMPAGNAGFRSVLSKTNHAGTELSALRGDRPEGAAVVRSALGITPETTWVTGSESTPGNYLLRIASLAAGTNTVTLHWEPAFATTLTWDPGTNDAGTFVVQHPPNDPGGWRFYRLNAQDTPVGAWRTVLRTISSAQFWMQVGAPTGNPASGNPGIFSGTTSNSARIYYHGQYSPGQDWHISVNAPPGAEYDLFSGEVYVENLGELLPWDSTTNNTAINPAANTMIGPEGVRFFRTTVTNGTPAWRLWVNNGADPPATLSRFIEVRQTRVPIPAASFDLRQLGQMLVVPPYLNQANAFFMAVSGPEGLVLNLDNRVQRIEPLDFGSNAVAQVMSGFRYRTFRVQVPVDQIGWQVNARTLSGDVDLALRRTEVGNEITHLAFSGATGTTSDSITLVPPTLTDGIYHITVYGKSSSTFTLQQGPPSVTDIPFVNSEATIPDYAFTNGLMVINDDPDRNGWRYYRVNDLPSQLGVIGWLLSLSSNAPGTEIALRLSALPGRWSTGGHMDFSSTTGFLERQGHQAGVWYVGIYSPVLALGEFRLETRPFLPQQIDLDTGVGEVSNQRAGSWEYFEIDVTNASLLGLEVQLTNTSGGGLRTQIRRDQIPYDNGSVMINASATPSWPSGAFVHGTGDWTLRTRTHGNNDYLFLAQGWPLQLGKYYVGVRNDSGAPRTYELRFATVGEEDSGEDHEILTLTNAPGSSVTRTLEPREYQIYRLTVTNDTKMLRLQLNVTQGEARFFLRREHLPGLPGAYGTGANIFDGTQFAMVERAGSEILTVLPENLQTNIPAGDYYVLVAAEGAMANYSSAGIGTGPTTYELTVLPELTPQDLGSFSQGDQLVIDASYTSPERRFYTIDIQPGVKSLELRLENLVGTTRLLWAAHTNLLQPGSTRYGWIGGWGYNFEVNSVRHLIPPAPGRYGFVLESLNGIQTAHSARLTLTSQEAAPLSAHDGDAAVTNQTPNSWRFFRVDVPATAGGDMPTAWDVQLDGVSHDGVQMVVSRGNFPVAFTQTPGLSSYSSTWPTNGQIVADYFLSQRTHGLARYGKELHLGWGWPVEAGDYFVGVFNHSDQPASYQIHSRLIGGIASTLPHKVESVAWPGTGVLATVSNLPAGEARYFRVSVPDGLPQFRLKLGQWRGEARMSLRRGSVPGTHLYQSYFNLDDRDIISAAYGKVGDEYISMLPAPGQTNAIPPGDYFITIISEGQSPPDNNTLGTGSVDCWLEVLPAVQSVDLGALPINDTLYVTNVTIWPERPYYRFTIPNGARSLQVFHQSLTNNSILLIRPGTNLIAAGGPLATNSLALNQETWTGGEGGLIYSVNPTLVLNDPPPGDYTFVAAPGNNSTVASVISLNLSGETPLNFTNDDYFYTNAPLTWRYFRVDVPTNAATELGVRGWEVRLADSPSDEGWSLVIRRDQLPPGGAVIGDNHTTWPSGSVYGGSGQDWTGRARPGMLNASYFASMAWGRPLEPGTYFIGVYNGSSQARSIRLLCRAIGMAGSGLPIQIEPLTFGATLQVTNTSPGTFNYYHLALPANQPAAKFQLHMVQGDARWRVRRSFVPGIFAGAPDLSAPANQIQTAVPGNDYMIWWPPAPATNLAADDYYFVVAAEGSPSNPDTGWLGTGPTVYELSSSVFTPEKLGPVTPLQDIVRDDVFDAGEVLAYEFEVTNTARALEIRLEDRVGSPAFDLGRGNGQSSSYSGWFGYNAAETVFGSAIHAVLTDQPANRYWITVGYKQPLGWAPYLANSFQLRVRSYVPHFLNFSSLLNTNGQTNVFSASLADGQREYFTFNVPDSLNGEPVLGWNLLIETLQGNPQARVRRGNLLPQDGNPDTTSYRNQGLVVAPPYFRPGIWTVEVRASGDSQFILTSEPVTLQRPAWALPALGQTTTNLGLLPPLFADTSILSDGSTLAEDVSLAKDRYHFYAVDVPAGNGGLIRAELLALSGNSDLYVRAGQIPTLEAALYSSFHNQIIGTYELGLNSGAVTEFANWVPADTRRQLELAPGRWYFMVHANGSNVRYRLKLGAGEVSELDLGTGTASAQNLAATDWRYYRFVVPTNPPQFWNLNVSQQQGDVDVYLRDTAPPGVAYGVNPATWAREAKNAGVAYFDYTTPANWQFTTPQLRPGHAYYVGVRAVVDSQFSIFSSTNGPLLTQAYPDLDYINPEGGSVTLTLSPFERRTWRVNVPPDALRWKQIATNSSAVGLYLQNGSPPWAIRNGPADHWASSGAANSIFETALSDRTQGSWPWVRGETYFISATNESAVAQDFYLMIDTRAWRLELAATNGSVVPSPNKPYYETGEIVNLTPVPAPGYRFLAWVEDLSGTNQPGQISMTAHRRVVALFEPIPYQILISAVNGTVQKSPELPTYTYGNVVLLTATPGPGYEFERWTGSLVSYENPLPVQVSGDLNLTAEFRLVATRPVIMEQPVGGTFRAGRPASLAVNAVGTQPMFYQWLKNGSDFAGENNTMLSFLNLSTNDAGRYAVLITNVAGATLSAEVPLNVEFVRSLEFTNSTPIVIRDATSADPYPSVVTVTGVSAPIASASVTLNNVTHDWLEDVDVLLVGPTGTNVLVLSDAGRFPAADQTFILSSDATNTVPETGSLGGSVFLPTDYPGLAPVSDAFLPPAAPNSPGTNLADFGGLDPSGNWQLFVMDDYGKDAGIIAGGWVLGLQTLELVSAPAPTPMALQVQTTTVAENGEFGFTFAGMRGHTVRIEASTNLIDWEMVAEIFVATGSEEFKEPTSGPGRFYRCRILP